MTPKYKAFNKLDGCIYAVTQLQWKDGFLWSITIESPLHLKKTFHEHIKATDEDHSDDIKQIILLQSINRTDKNGIEIFKADILKVETSNHKTINVVCEIGSQRRMLGVIGNSYEVEITGIYFKRADGLKSFPITKNWQGKHDLDCMEIIGNINQNPERMDG